MRRIFVLSFLGVFILSLISYGKRDCSKASPENCAKCCSLAVGTSPRHSRIDSACASLGSIYDERERRKKVAYLGSEFEIDERDLVEICGIEEGNSGAKLNYDTGSLDAKLETPKECLKRCPRQRKFKGAGK